MPQPLLRRQNPSQELRTSRKNYVPTYPATDPLLGTLHVTPQNSSVQETTPLPTNIFFHALTSGDENPNPRSHSRRETRAFLLVTGDHGREGTIACVAFSASLERQAPVEALLEARDHRVVLEHVPSQSQRGWIDEQESAKEPNDRGHVGECACNPWVLGGVRLRRRLSGSEVSI